MEEFVPIVIGALATACVAGIVSMNGLGTAQGGTGVGPASNAWLETVRSRAILLAHLIGCAVPPCIAEHRVIARCVDELAVSGVDSATRLGALLLVDAAVGMACAVVALSPFGLIVGLAAPWVLLTARASRRERTERARVEAEMPEAFAALSIALGSGHSLAQGMRFVGGHAQEPVKTEFMRVSFAIDCGVPAAIALDELLERLPAPGLGLVSLALKVSQRTGAPLRGLLADAADMVGERMELARRLDVKTSQARMSARLVALMPVAMVALLMLLSKDFRTGLSTPVGIGSVAVALVLNIAAWGIIQRIMEVDVR